MRIIAALLAVHLSTSLAFGCLCPVPSIEESLVGSDLIFAGQVLDITEADLEEPTGISPGYQIVSFMPYHVWKGIPNTPETVLTSAQVSNCGYKFQIGAEYLVYATRSPNGFKTTSCTRTRPLRESTLDFALLPPPVSKSPDHPLDIPDVAELVSKVLEELESGSPQLVYSKLVDLGPLHSLLLPRLVEVAKSLDKSDRKKRIVAIKTIGSFGYNSRSAVPDLIQLLVDQDPVVRQEAAVSLRNVFPESEELEPDFFSGTSRATIGEYSRVAKELSRLEVPEFPPGHLKEKGGFTGGTYMIRR